MSRVRWKSGTCLLCLFFADFSFAQRTTGAVLERQAAQAYQTKDYATYLALEKQLEVLLPDDVRVKYNVACGQALTGNAAEAVHTLDKFLERKLDPGAEADPDFDRIRGTPEWKLFQEHLAHLREPLLRSSTAFTLPGKALVATGIAVDEANGDVFVASARQRKIVKRTRDGAISDFATAKQGLLAVWGLWIDPIHRQLIASTAGSALMQDFEKQDGGKSGLCFFDLASGKLTRQVFFPTEAGRHFLNSLVSDKAGNVFVVDAATAEIYRLRRSSAELELFVSSVVFRAPSGLALSADERTLYVSDFLDGISAVEVLSLDRRHLDAPVNTWLAGLNGLTRVASGFIAVQAGVQPNRVIQIRLDPKGEQIVAVETLESNHPDYAGPSQGVFSQGDFLYVANSQFTLADAKTGNFAEDRAKPTVILRMPAGK